MTALTSKWRCVCPNSHHYIADYAGPPGATELCTDHGWLLEDASCPRCGEEPDIIVRVEQSGSFDD